MVFIFCHIATAATHYTQTHTFELFMAVSNTDRGNRKKHTFKSWYPTRGKFVKYDKRSYSEDETNVYTILYSILEWTKNFYTVEMVINVWVEV